MPLDPRVKRFLDALAAGAERQARDTSIAARRYGLAELMRLSGPEIPVGGIADRTVDGPAGTLPVRVYTPAEAPGPLLPGLIYFHGGGLVAGSIASHDSIARALAAAGRCRVASVGYRLAPEHPFPAAVDDAAAAVAAIGAHAQEFGIDPSLLGICGDSAGATLAAAACQIAVRSGAPALAAQLLLCPILDHSRTSASRRELARGYFLDQATLDDDLRHYLPADADRADPRISPLRAASLAGMPRTMIHSAEFDPLRDEAHNYFETLSQSECDVTYTCHPGMIHMFYGLGGVVPYARSAYAQIGAELRAVWAQAARPAGRNLETGS